MTIDLSQITFENDFFTTSLPDESILVLNRIDELIGFKDSEIKINRINIQIYNEDTETYKTCSSVIGLSEGNFSIKTLYKEYEGNILTEENMKYCTIEIEEE